MYIVVILCNFLFVFLFCCLDKQQRRINRGGVTLLFLTKTFGFLDGKQQLLLQLLVAFVGRQIQTVKTEKTQKKTSQYLTINITPLPFSQRDLSTPRSLTKP